MEIWSVGTALRNPLRITGFLGVLNNFLGANWDNQCQLDYYIELIRVGEVSPRNISANQLMVIQTQARSIMLSNYEDAPMRGRVLGSLFEKLGLVDLNRGVLALTNRGNQLLNGNITLSESLIEGLSEWQYIHAQSQWSSIVNGLPISRRFSPFVATLYLIGRVNILSGSNTGISYREFNYFAKTLDNYSLVDIFANCIINIRANPNNAATFITYVNNNFTNIKNANDYIDNDIKYFVQSELIQSNYIGNGLNCNFANLNYVHLNEIINIVHTYIPNALQI
ncbi:AlwI family type II restriction endonuclease [Clostridium sp. BL-8]|uniref:AlwI family type II restriction endonuclease n=1 Tax=Clostridium sp. BL-8 TaxID=349938 RepID=UPI00098C4D50|nr:AlwI family type II restriction endonuclease [Clostridium sp. BL-8]OOM78824.1 AlwI restriction endonuclease [Clostridium sp. BL-8]